MSVEYDYMIKTIASDGTSFNQFKYPLETGALVEAPDWDPSPICGGGLHGLVHWTKNHIIENNPIWMILKFIRKEAVVIDNEKIKVPRAWVEYVGDAAGAQRRFAELTGREYTYDYAVQSGGDQSTQTAGDYSNQVAGINSKQIAGVCSTQTAGNNSTQIAGDYSNQVAGINSKQIAGVYSTQTAWSSSTQTAGDYSIQTARIDSKQIAGVYSTQAAWSYSTQTAGNGSVSIIRGAHGYCCHKGRVLQVMVVWDEDNNRYEFPSIVINGDGTKYALRAVKVQGKWQIEIRKEVDK